MGTNINPQELQAVLEQMRHKPLLTGYPELDAMSGGLPQGGLTVVGGRPAMGVTSLLLNMVIRIAQTEPGTILYLTTEHSERDLTARILEIGMNLEAQWMLDGTIFRNQILQRCTSFFQSLKGHIQIEGLLEPSLDYLRLRCQDTQDLRLIVVDSPEDFYSAGDRYGIEHTHVPVEKVLGELQKIAVQRNVPIVCPAYLDRKLELRKDRRPKLTDLKNKTVAALADLVLLLYRESYYQYSYDDSAQCIVAKSPSGRTGIVELLWDSHSRRFDDMLPF